MKGSSHEDHIARHLELLSRIHGKEKVQAVLERCGLEFDGKIATLATGGKMMDMECKHYVKTIEQIFGASTSMFARANFALAGCSWLATANS